MAFDVDHSNSTMAARGDNRREIAAIDETNDVLPGDSKKLGCALRRHLIGDLRNSDTTVAEGVDAHADNLQKSACEPDFQVVADLECHAPLSLECVSNPLNLGSLTLSWGDGGHERKLGANRPKRNRTKLPCERARRHRRVRCASRPSVASASFFVPPFTGDSTPPTCSRGLRVEAHCAKGKTRDSQKASPEAKAISALLKKNKVKGVSFDVRRDTVVLRVPLSSVALTGRALAAFKPNG